MKYKLSSGHTGTSNSSKEDFKKRLKKGVSIILWECEDANCTSDEGGKEND